MADTIEHRCAWCGREATAKQKGRYACTHGACEVGPHDRDRARDESGENGPETWVDVGKMPNILGWLCDFAENAAPGRAIAISSTMATAAGISRKGTIAGHAYTIDHNATQHVRIVDDRAEMERECAVEDEPAIPDEPCGYVPTGPKYDAVTSRWVCGTCGNKVFTIAQNPDTGRDVCRNCADAPPEKQTPLPNSVMRGYIDTLTAMGVCVMGPADQMPEPTHDDAGPLHTHTAEFELPDGRRTAIPEPGEGWEREGEQVFDWPAKHVINYEKGVGDDGWGFETPDRRWDVNHEAGRCWLHDMGQPLYIGKARVLSVTRWRRVPVPPVYDEAYHGFDSPLFPPCASAQPLRGDWPDRRPSGMVKVKP